jgi:hypothetical protein
LNPATIQKLCDLSGMELFPEGVERGLHRWRDETYDVWIDGCLDRQAQVLMRGAKAEHAVLSPRLRQVLLIDLERGVVNAAPREGFVLAPDRETALSEPTLSPQRVGSCSRFRGHGFLLSMEGGPHLVIVPPTGLIGELTPDRLWEDVPVWRAIFDSYEPEPGIVAELAAAGPYELTIVMAAWCHLSKELVPGSSGHWSGQPIPGCESA